MRDHIMKTMIYLRLIEAISLNFSRLLCSFAPLSPSEQAEEAAEG